MNPFVFEFYPMKLDQWVKRRKIQMDQRHIRKQKQMKFRLQQMVEQYRQLPPSNDHAFWRWIDGLTRREKVLLPDMYVILDEKGMGHVEKSRLARAIWQNTHLSHQFFERILLALYKTCDLEHLWHPLRQAYALNKQKVEKRMNEENKHIWLNFLVSKNPIRYLADRAYRSFDGIEPALQPYRLDQHHPFFTLVFLEVLKSAEEHADEHFFMRQKELFQEIFERTKNYYQQRMVESMIRSCQRLDRVRDLALWIYHKIGTYHTNPMQWSYVGEKEKIRFAQWILRDQLEDFFVGVNKEHERFQYWKKFIPYMVNVVVIDNNETLLMYFHDVVIMEVIGTGAVYVYEVQTFRKHFQEKVDHYLEQKRLHEENPWIRSYELKRNELMDRDKVYQNGWLRHDGVWQKKFDDWLRTQLGWEVNERVLEAKMV